MLRFLIKSALRTVSASYNTPERIGARGEKRVHHALTSVLDNREYRVFSDIVLPVSGGTTQVDHVLLSRFGIFAIETKNMSGWIFGSASQKTWTQVLKGGKRRKFQNPLRQNHAHVKALEANLEVDRSVLYNFVVFTGSAKPKSDMPEGVAWGLRELGRLIALRRTPVISDKEMENYARKLSVLASNSTAEAQRQHVMQLERKAAQAKVVPLRPPGGDGGAPSCPRCSGAMVKRSNRKTGKSFWGCTDFPKCRGTRK